MTPASTTREDVEDAIGRLMHGPDDVAHEAAEELSEAARALLDERDALIQSRDFARRCAETATQTGAEARAEVERIRNMLERATLCMPAFYEKWHKDARAALAGAPSHD